MKTSPYTMLCAAALAGVLASCSPPAPTVTRMQVSSSAGRDSTLSAQLFSEVNSYRASKGKPALMRHDGLDQLAQQHCDYLVKTAGNYGIYGKNISHIGFESRSLVARQTYKIDVIGENVVSSATPSARHLVGLWAGSKNHEHNMRDQWAYTGVATAISNDGQVVSTQLFGTAPSTSHMDLRNRLNRAW